MSTPNATVATVGLIGVGDPLMCDEGVGIWALRELQQHVSDDDVEFIEAGPDTRAVLDDVRKCTHLIILDAILGGSRPGSIYRLALESIEESGSVMSLHGHSLYHLLQYERLLGNVPGEVLVLGMEPERVELLSGLSETCRQRLPQFLEAVQDEIHALQARSAGSEE